MQRRFKNQEVLEKEVEVELLLEELPQLMLYSSCLRRKEVAAKK